MTIEIPRFSVTKTPPFRFRHATPAVIIARLGSGLNAKKKRAQCYQRSSIQFRMLPHSVLVDSVNISVSGRGKRAVF